jgi:preprotein translocase subunit SecA
VHLRQMAQKDPLVEYTAEGERMFTELGRIIRGEVVLQLFHVEIATEDAQQQLSQQSQTSNGSLHYQHETSAGAAAIAEAGGGGGLLAGIPSGPGGTAQPVRVSEHDKLGRNDPCWCGSGKKFKKCHGA